MEFKEEVVKEEIIKEEAMQSDFDLEALLREGAGRFGLELDSERQALFFKFMEMLKEWNKKFNLTAIEEDRDIVIKHFIDSLSILPYIKGYGSPSGLSMADIGTGAGFPGIPVKIAFPGIRMTLVDSLRKRVDFLKEAVKLLGLDDVAAIHGRAEDLGHSPELREKFDLAAARAVAALPVLLEYCLPFVKVGGLFIAMKGSDIQEVESSQKALEILGGEIIGIDEIVLPSSDIKRNIIIIKKFRQISTNYPRKAGKPSKNPLL